MILVSLDSPRGRVNVAVPEDVSVEQLLPELVESAGLDPHAARWSLRPKTGSPLDGASTLSQSGVFEGAILELATDRATPGAPAPPGKPWAASWLAVARDRAGRGLESAWRAGRYSLAPRLQDRLAAARSRPERATSAPAPRRHAVDRPEARGNRQPGLRDLDRVIATPRLAAGLLVAVVPEEPGAGATTVTALLATLLARLRTDRVIAVDAGAGSASLSLHLAGGRRLAAPDLLTALSSGTGSGGLNQHLVTAKHGLQVVPAVIPGGNLAEGLDDQAYLALFHQLTRLARITLVDCGKLDTPAARVAVEGADLAVVVCRSDLTALPWWDPNRRLLQRLVPSLDGSRRSAILVLNRARRAGGASPGASSVPGARAAVALANEPAAAARLRAAAFDWERAPRSWQTDVRRLAAVLLSGQDAAAG